MHDDTNELILGRLDDFEFELDIILAGIDRNLQPHIYLISEPGDAMSFDEVGFCCKGSGETHTDPVFAFYGYSPSLPTEQVLYIAYEAKKRAEMAGSVGKQTDAWVVNEKGCYKVKQETLEALDECKMIEDLSSLIGGIEIELDDEPEVPPDEM